MQIVYTVHRRRHLQPQERAVTAHRIRSVHTPRDFAGLSRLLSGLLSAVRELRSARSVMTQGAYTPRCRELYRVWSAQQPKSRGSLECQLPTPGHAVLHACTVFVHANATPMIFDPTALGEMMTTLTSSIGINPKFHVNYTKSFSNVSRRGNENQRKKDN